MVQMDMDPSQSFLELSGAPLPKMLDWFRRVAVWSYSLGTGMFLVLFVQSVQ